nr:MAG TPA: hypothetical protein [Bacteriophage sp.]
MRNCVYSVVMPGNNALQTKVYRNDDSNIE